eukprot:967644-Pelagomonas_calceolata.AAC.6
MHSRHLKTIGLEAGAKAGAKELNAPAHSKQLLCLRIGSKCQGNNPGPPQSCLPHYGQHAQQHHPSEGQIRSPMLASPPTNAKLNHQCLPHHGQHAQQRHPNADHQCLLHRQQMQITSACLTVASMHTSAIPMQIIRACYTANKCQFKSPVLASPWPASAQRHSKSDPQCLPHRQQMPIQFISACLTVASMHSSAIPMQIISACLTANKCQFKSPVLASPWPACTAAPIRRMPRHLGTSRICCVFQERGPALMQLRVLQGQNVQCARGASLAKNLKPQGAPAVAQVPITAATCSPDHCSHCTDALSLP